MEILALLLISFSPLLSDVVRVTGLLVMTIYGLSRTSFTGPRTYLLLGAFMAAFTTGLILDLTASSGAQLRVLSLYYPLCFLLGFLISERYTLGRYLSEFETIAYYAALLSLLGVVLYLFFPEYVQALPIYRFEHTQHHTAYLFNILVDGDSVVNRNAGFTWEPGILQLVINLGLLAAIYKYRQGIPPTRYVVYALALLATRSTVGLFLFVVLSIVLASRSRTYRWLFVGVVLLFSDAFRREWGYQTTTKLAGSYAFNSRLTPGVEAMSNATGNWFGIGNAEYALNAMSLGILSYDSFSQIAIRYGFFLLLVVVGCIVALGRKHLLLATILAATLLSQTIWFCPFITPFYFFAFHTNEDLHPGGSLESTLDHQRASSRSRTRPT